MYKISTLNKISEAGLRLFSDRYSVSDGTDGFEGSAGLLVRSAAMHDMKFDDELIGITRAGAGVNNIPLDRCADQGIVVFNTPGANANAVKELIIGALIMSARNLAEGIEWEKTLSDDNDMSKKVEKGKAQFAGTEVKGKILGVVGLGAIGALVANTAVKLGIKVSGYDPYIDVKSALRLDPSVKIVQELEKLLPECDYVTLHLPSTDSTNGMFDAKLFSYFKNGAVLLNFSRDKLVNETDLLAALDSGRLSRYTTDFATPGILGRDGVVCTPHLGASTTEAEDNCASMAAEELIDLIENGNVMNSVNFPSVDLGTRPAGETRIAILTKNVDDPVSLAVKMLAGVRIRQVTGSARGSYGYALASTDEDVTDVAKADGVTKVRIIK